LRKRTTPDFIAAFGRRLPRSQKASLLPSKPVAVVAKHARVERSTVYRRIERYLAERAPCSLADGKRSGRSRMTPALTHAVQRILAWVPVAAHLATYLAKRQALRKPIGGFWNWSVYMRNCALPEGRRARKRYVPYPLPS